MSLYVRYIDTPVGAQEAAEVSGSEIQPFSDYSNIASGVADTPWATLEPGVWPLDGTRALLRDNSENVGWWSETTSGDDCSFDAPPTIEIMFAEPYTTTALSFTFWPSTEQWCSKMNVSWHNGDTLLASVTVYPDKAKWVLEQSVESFDKITVEILETNKANQFAKIQQIQIGQVVTFGKNELTSVRVLNEADPSLCNLSVDTMRIEIQNRNGKLLIPQENQQMELYKNDRLMAVQYIQQSSREAKFYYTISCQSAIGLLGDDFLGGMYVDSPVETVLDDILDGRKHLLDAAFSGQVVTGYLPICSRRVALQQLAFALGAMVTTQESDAIRLIPLPAEVTGSFAASKIFPGAKASNSPRIAKIVLISHSYTPTDTEEVLLDKESISGENVLITFDDPHYDYVISGGELIGSGANWVTITAYGAVTLRAKTYLHNTMQHVRRNPSATAAERNNVLTVDEATLINSGNAQAAMDRLYEAKLMRQTLTHEVVVSGHKAGQRVSSVNPWGTYTLGYTTSMESTLTQNGHTAQVEILGTEVTEVDMG